MRSSGLLRRVLAPRSIAVIGGDPAQRVVEQCLKLGFEGNIWPVHPRRRDLAGVECFPSIESLPSAPDAAFIGVNRDATIEAVRQLRAIGAGGAVAYGSGFAEAGDDDRQHELVVAAETMPVFGPNCYGFVNTFDRVALWPDEHGCAMFDRGVAIVSQSGNVAVNLTLQQRSLRLGTMITVGNQAAVGTEDCIDALLDDERITTIGLFIEAVRDPQRFADVCARAHHRGVPIVALQTGRSAVGAAIATSHTGSMSGRTAAYDALFERCGVAVVATPSELLESLKLLDFNGKLASNRLVSLSCSGGEASLVADQAEPLRLEFREFDADHRARIATTVGPLVSVSNPFDYHTFMWGDRAAMATCFEAVMRGDQAATMLVLDAPPSTTNDATAWITAVDAIGDATQRTGATAVVVATLAEGLNDALRTHIIERSMVPLLGLADGLRALEVAAHVGQHCAPPHAPVPATGATRITSEAEAKQWLASAGVEVPAGVLCTATEVLTAAFAVGYPITVKSLGIAHKSEAGAVRVGINDERALRAALEAMPDTDLGYLVEATVPDAVAEILVSVRRDPPVGWVVTIGHGGVTTELWADVTHLLAPVSRDDVLHAIAKLRCAPLLGGFRGKPPAAIDRLVDAVVQITNTAVGSDVVEIECNPILVTPTRAVAVDALMTVEDT